MGGLTYHEQIMRELQAHAINMHVRRKMCLIIILRFLKKTTFVSQFADLYRMVQNIAIQAGARVRYNAKVVDIDVSAPHVVLEGGERIKGDIIIGADGGESFVREKLFGKDEFQVGPSNGYKCVPFQFDVGEAPHTISRPTASSFPSS